MGELVLPKRYRRVVINADNDANGIGLAGAGKLARRLHAEGRHTEIVQTIACKDSNDLLRRAVA